MAQLVEDWYKQMPIITRTYLTLSVLTTAGCALEVFLLSIPLRSCVFRGLKSTLFVLGLCHSYGSLFMFTHAGCVPVMSQILCVSPCLCEFFYVGQVVQSSCIARFVDRFCLKAYYDQDPLSSRLLVKY